MATTKRPQAQRFLTPAGIAVFPKLNAPDTKFDADGVYTVKLRFNADDAEKFIESYEQQAAKSLEQARAEIQARLAEASGAAKGKIRKELEDLKASDKAYKPSYDDDGEETGDFEFTFKMPATFVKDKGKATERRMQTGGPDLFDAKGKLLRGKTKGGQRIDNAPDIWGGSTLIVAGEFRPFYTAKAGAGVSLRMNAVQIVELVQGRSSDAAGYGFGAHEGGFEGSEEPTMPSSDDGVAPAAGSDDVDGAAF